MKKRIFSLLLATVFFTSVLSFPTYAAKNSDVTRVYKKVFTTTDFMQKLYSVVPLYTELGLTNDSVTKRIKLLINDVLDGALYRKSTGELTKSNIEKSFKEIIMLEVQYMEAEYLSLLLDSFPEKTIEEMLEGTIPNEFKDLARVLAKEAYYILGYNEIQTDIIFDDMKGHEWSIPAVDYLFNLDIISGTGDFVFNPGGNVTREQFVKMMCAAFEEHIIPSGENTLFSDVPANAWYHPYVTKMASAGLIKGVSDSLFGTGNNIKRQDIAVLIFRIGEELGYFTSEELTLPFNDQNSISPYAVTAVNTLRNNKILNGNQAGNFNPHSGATRAEAAQMIYNFYIFASNLNK